MKAWLACLLLFAIAMGAALGWPYIARDPGYVVIQWHDVTLESSLIFTALVLLLGWLLLSLAWRLLHWPGSAWSRRTRRRGRERLAQGLLALVEGRYSHAMRELSRAKHSVTLKAPALLGLAYAAQARNESVRAMTALDQASDLAPMATLVMRAHLLLQQSNPQAALAVLKAPATTGKLTPAGWRLLIESALKAGDSITAFDALTPLQRTRSLSSVAMDELQTRVLVAALTAATDANQLQGLWSGLHRNQRHIVEVRIAYARRAVALGQTLAAMSELEDGLRKTWSEPLVLCYGELGIEDAPTRLRNAEAWLKKHPESPGLLLTLGRLCRDQALWGKAHEYLTRALALEETSSLWETIGDCYAGEHIMENAALCYRNALHRRDGKPGMVISIHPMRHELNTQAAIVEERSALGIPRLPVSRKS